MATKKIYGGSSIGPLLYDDTLALDDPDGDFAGVDFHALVTDGQLYVEGTPTLDYHVARKVDVPSSYVFDVESYGAGTGESAATNTTAIQAAIDAAEAAGGGIVLFGLGSYQFTTLTIDDPGVVLVGQGVGATRLITTTSTGNVISIGDTVTAFNEAGGIRELTLDSSGNRTSGYMIYIDGCEDGLIDNIKIGDAGYDVGNGIYFGSNLSTVWTVSNSDLEISGAFKGIHIDGGNDRYFTNLWLRGDHTNASGAVGIYIQQSGGDWFTDVEVVEFYYGVRIRPENGETVAWLNMTNALTDSNDLIGFMIDPNSGGLVYGISLTSLWASSNGAGIGGISATINGRGIEIQNSGVDGVSIQNPRIINNGGHGIYVDSNAININITGGIVSGNSLASSGTAHGVAFDDTTKFSIVGTRSGQTSGRSNTQGYGLFIDTNCNYFIATNNNCYGNVTGTILNNAGTSTNKVYDNNVTQGSGSGGISNVVEDTTPQLGGDLDVNGHSINGHAVSGSLTVSGGGSFGSGITGTSLDFSGDVDGNRLLVNGTSAVERSGSTMYFKSSGALYLHTAGSTAATIDSSGNTTIVGTLQVNGDQTGATDHVFDDYDDIQLLENWRNGDELPFNNGDLLNRDRLLRDAIMQLNERVARLELN